MINVYWSPYYSIHPQDKDLEIFYGDIEHARKESMDNMNDNLGFSDNFLNCPLYSLIINLQLKRAFCMYI
jgi:hypothetical protein